jgi:hypothetical protein
MIDEFLRDLDHQTDLYREMLATSDVPRLQALLREIGDIDARIAPIRRRWKDVVPRLDAPTAERAGRSIDAARDVLARLVDRMVPPRRVSDAYGC